MSAQQSIMRFDPATGARQPYPSHAEQWRKHHGQVAWMFNPWSGQMRDARDVGSDVFGTAIRCDHEEPLRAATAAPVEEVATTIALNRSIAGLAAPYGRKANGEPRAKPGRKRGSRNRKTARTTRAK